MPKIVFAADSHLNKHYMRMTPDQLSLRRDKLRLGWSQTVDFAIRERADLYIHGGDLFDNSNPRAAELVWTAGQFQRLADAGVKVLLIGGNHDIPKSRQQGATPQRLFDAVRLAHVFTRPTAVEWWTTEIGGVKLAIGGLPPDPRLGLEEDPLAVLQEPISPPEADCVLLVTHYAVEGTLHPLAEEPTIKKASIAALAGTVDYMLLGHIHTGREMDIGGVKVFFPGPTERTNFGELDVRCGFGLITIEGRRPCRIQSRHIYLDPQPMRRETVRTTDIPDEEPTAWLTERVRGWSAADQILQVRLEGPLVRAKYHALRFLDVFQVGHDLNFYFDLDRHTVELRDETAAAVRSGIRVSPRSELARVADVLMEAADSDEERELLAEARSLVLEQYGTGALDES